MVECCGTASRDCSAAWRHLTETRPPGCQSLNKTWAPPRRLDLLENDRSTTRSTISSHHPGQRGPHPMVGRARGPAAGPGGGCRAVLSQSRRPGAAQAPGAGRSLAVRPRGRRHHPLGVHPAPALPRPRRQGPRGTHRPRFLPRCPGAPHNATHTGKLPAGAARRGCRSLPSRIRTTSTKWKTFSHWCV